MNIFRNIKEKNRLLDEKYEDSDCNNHQVSTELPQITIVGRSSSGVNGSGISGAASVQEPPPKMFIVKKLTLFQLNRIEYRAKRVKLATGSSKVTAPTSSRPHHHQMQDPIGGPQRPTPAHSMGGQWPYALTAVREIAVEYALMPVTWCHRHGLIFQARPTIYISAGQPLSRCFLSSVFTTTTNNNKKTCLKSL